MNQPEQLHSIQQISTKLNIPKPTLRFWEKEFEGLLLPLRTHGGQRRYTSEHIALVEKINALKKAGLSLAEIRRKLIRGVTSGSSTQRLGDGTTVEIDILVERVTDAVKAELLKFLKTKEEQGSRRKLNT
jgi:DNA-binding transcriptional MerR regulator